MYYRYLDLPFKIEEPDRSLLNDFVGCCIRGMVNNFTYHNFEKDLDSFRDASYDKDIILDNEFKFNFQHSFEKWFYSYTDKIKLGEYYIVQTKGGVANPIHSDTCPITNVSKTKINFTFADYNSCLEYFWADAMYESKENENDGAVMTADEKDCKLIEKIKYENYYPVLLDTNSFHRGNNRNCKNRRLTISYDLQDLNGNFVNFTDAVNIFKKVFVPNENKFYMLSDF